MLNIEYSKLFCHSKSEIKWGKDLEDTKPNLVGKGSYQVLGTFSTMVQ
jgi:hypothetical protein